MSLKSVGLILLMMIDGANIYSQNSIYLNFPIIDSTQSSIAGEQILSEIHWPSLKTYCDSIEGHHARETHGELFKTYRYVKQGYTASLELTLYDGKVLEYRSHVDELFQTNYFDRGLWMEYVRSDEELKDSKWLLSEEEMDRHHTKSIQAYITMLGFNVRDEYGWICEYSATGFPPEKRRAIIDLINYRRRDFITRLLDHPNPQTQLYAADALIYLDMIGHVEVVELENFRGGRRSRRYHLRRSKEYQLSSNEWREIRRIRDANQGIITCGNMGSYKQYRSTSAELLSDESIEMIYTNYLNLRRLGYLWR